MAPKAPGGGSGKLSLTLAQYRAQVLRKQLTRWEAILWVHLRSLRSRGFHMRKQVPFRGYVLDFACFERRVAIELDGDHHGLDERRAHDGVRDAVLRDEGFLVLRFQNREVTGNLDGVMRRIVEALQTRSPTRPLRGHPPDKREG